VKQTELFMLHHAAMDQRDPKVLGKLHADLMSSLTATLQMCLQAVLGDGVVIRTPKVELAKDGYPGDAGRTTSRRHEARHLRVPREPAVQADLGPDHAPGPVDERPGPHASAAEEEDPAGIGTLSLQGGTSRESLEDFSRRAADAMVGVREQLARGQSRMRQDPVLIEHEAQGDRA
jgi:hypothetical protein